MLTRKRSRRGTSPINTCKPESLKACPLARMFLLIAIFFSHSAVAFGGDAVLSWDPNTEPDLAGYKVYYGTVSSTYGTPIDVGINATHTVTGLGLGTYFFAVTAYDTSGNESSFSNEVTKTFGNQDITPPLISAISTNSVTSGSATIAWTTNEPSDTQIEYGTTTAYGSSTPLDMIFVTTHTQSITGLLPSTTYNYRVISTDGAGNTASSGNNSFTTASIFVPDTTPPLISAISTNSVTSGSATITWTTNEPSDTQIEYGTTTAYGSSTTLGVNLVNAHNQVITGLQPSTIYNYRVISTDTAGNTGFSGNNSFTTASISVPDTTPPADIQSFTANGSNQEVTLTWMNPPDLDFVGVRIVYRTDRFPIDINDGTLLGDFNGLPDENMSTTHTGLTNGTTYYYLASSFDDQGNFQMTTFASATPLEPPSNSPESPSGGGCGMIIPREGKPPGPWQAADMLAIVGIILLVLMKKGMQAFRFPGLQEKS